MIACVGECHHSCIPPWFISNSGLIPYYILSTLTRCIFSSAFPMARPDAVRGNAGNTNRPGDLCMCWLGKLLLGIKMDIFPCDMMVVWESKYENARIYWQFWFTSPRPMTVFQVSPVLQIIRVTIFQKAGGFRILYIASHILFNWALFDWVMI